MNSPKTVITFRICNCSLTERKFFKFAAVPQDLQTVGEKQKQRKIQRDYSMHPVHTI